MVDLDDRSTSAVAVRKYNIWMLHTMQNESATAKGRVCDEGRFENIISRRSINRPELIGQNVACFSCCMLGMNRNIRHLLQIVWKSGTNYRYTDTC